MGALHHNAEGPLCSAYSACRTEREPLVIPPPTPTNTGTSGHTDDGLGNGGLGGKGIDRDDGVSVDVLDDGHIGGEHQGFDAAAKDADAAAF